SFSLPPSSGACQWQPWHAHSVPGSSNEGEAPLMLTPIGSGDGLITRAGRTVGGHVRLCHTSVPPQQDPVDDSIHPFVRLDALHANAAYRFRRHDTARFADYFRQINLRDDLLGDCRYVEPIDECTHVEASGYRVD